MTAVTNKESKPIQLRIIFILNAMMMILPFIFYFVVTKKNVPIGGLDPMYMIYTGIAYTISFALLVLSILRKKLLAMRVIIGLNLLIALPAKAYIGIIAAITSMVLSFTPKVKMYFESSE